MLRLLIIFRTSEDELHRLLPRARRDQLERRETVDEGIDFQIAIRCDRRSRLDDNRWFDKRPLDERGLGRAFVLAVLGTLN